MVDKLFHDHQFFVDQTKFLKDLLRKVPFKNKFVKPHSIAHVLLELLLDGVLIREKEASVADFYTHLKKVDLNMTVDFLAAAGLQDTSHFRDYYYKFLEYEYVYSYKDAEMVYYALNRIFGRVWGSDFELNRDAIIKVINKGYEHLTIHYREIFDIIDMELNPKPNP